MILRVDELTAQLSVALDMVEKDLVGVSLYHGKRVGMLCLAMGRHLGYTGERLSALACCGMLHDNALTEYILSEHPGSTQALNLKTHCVLGEKNIAFLPISADTHGYVLYHHERADGQGPFHREEKDFPKEAALIALADQLDARFHLDALPLERLEEVLQFVRQNAGVAFTLEATQAIEAVLSEELLEEMRSEVVADHLRQWLPPLERELSDESLVLMAGMVSRIIDYKSEFTRKHSVQIANKAWLMACRYHYPPRECAEIFLAAALHDVGKLMMPTAILEKPSALTREEFQEIKRHPLYTWEILGAVTGLEKVAIWASDHHEKLDGSGYPFGKNAQELDKISRLLACLDIYQAVRETRPYHPMRSHEETMKVLWDMANKGLIDATITGDIDNWLVELPQGDAPEPEIA